MLMDHNIEVYKKFECMVNKSKKCILITATGTGKSYIVAEYLDRYNLRALAICPKILIADNWKKVSSRVETITYHKFYILHKFHKNEFYEILNRYDIVIFDEAHHVGSPVWGDAFKKLEEKSLEIRDNTKFVGLTASSRRYLDNDRDVAYEYFDGNIIYGYSQLEAIESGILPSAEYIISLFNSSSIYKKYRLKAELISNTLVGQLDYAFKNAEAVEDILIKYMPNNKRKGIIFVDRIESVPTARELINNTFPNAKIFEIHSGYSQKNNIDGIKEFENYNGDAYIISIDMLNEGMHIDGINTIIMLRRTVSPMVYMQQIGRGLSSTGNQKLYIFDFVGNTNSIRIIKKNKDGINNVVSYFGGDRERKISNQIIVNDYISPILNILRDIDIRFGEKVKYSEEEDKFIIDNYDKGLKYCSNVLGRSKESISNRAAVLNVEGRRTVRGDVTEEEKKFILDNPNMSADELSQKLNLKPITIRKYRKLLGLTKPITRHTYTEEIDNMIREYYGKPKWAMEVSNITGIPANNISSRACKLGLRSRNTVIIWTDDMIQFIKDNAGEKGIDYCSSKLGLDRRQVYQKLRREGISFAPTVDLRLESYKEFIRSHPDMDIHEIAKALNLSKAHALKIANSIGYTNKNSKQFHEFTEEMNQFLIDNYYKYGRAICAKYLGVPEHVIKHRAAILGLKTTGTSSNKISWAEDEINILINEYPIYGEECFKKIRLKSDKKCKIKAKSLGLIKK